VTTIFDAKTLTKAVEVKNVQKLFNSNQLRAQIQHADDNELLYQLIVNPTSCVSGPVVREINRIGGSIQRFNPATDKFMPYP